MVQGSSENPEDDIGPWQSVSRVARQPTKKRVAIRAYADYDEFELQTRCVCMVDNLLDEEPIGTNEVSNKSAKVQRLLRFQQDLADLE